MLGFMSPTFSLLSNVVPLLLAVHLIMQDIRYLSVPLWAVIAWCACSIAAALFHWSTVDDCFSFIALAAVGGLLWGYQYLRGKTLIGTSDIALMISVGPWISLNQLPAFLSLTGLFGILIAGWYQSQRFPFLLAMFLSLLFSL